MTAAERRLCGMTPAEYLAELLERYGPEAKVVDVMQAEAAREGEVAAQAAALQRALESLA